MATSHKTNRSLIKRVKITGSGKVLKRRNHQNHFNAKESGNATRGKRGNKPAPSALIKSIRAVLSPDN